MVQDHLIPLSSFPRPFHSVDYIDWAKARKRAFPNLKPSVKSISIRFPQALIEQYKILANKQDVPYQSLMKVHLAERLEKELR